MSAWILNLARPVTYRSYRIKISCSSPLTLATDVELEERPGGGGNGVGIILHCVRGELAFPA